MINEGTETELVGFFSRLQGIRIGSIFLSVTPVPNGQIWNLQ